MKEYKLIRLNDLDIYVAAEDKCLKIEEILNAGSKKGWNLLMLLGYPKDIVLVLEKDNVVAPNNDATGSIRFGSG